MAKVTAPNNMDIWNALGKTDPAHTKPFTRGGGFRGTAVKPMWGYKIMTDYFGPCGNGWGTDKPEYQIVEADGELLVFCTVALWYAYNGEKYGPIYGIGGDKILAKGKDGVRSDDEAMKKAYTDALSNAMKFIGVAADVHMGQFDDNKYVREVAAEFEEQKKKEVIAEVERQKGPSNIGPASGKGDAGIEPLPPELDWSYQRSSGVLICRIMDAKVGKIKTGNNAGKEYVILTVNNELDKGKKPDLFYWHATHREALLAAKGKVVKLLILAKEKGFTVDAVMEIDGKRVAALDDKEGDTEGDTGTSVSTMLTSIMTMKSAGSKLSDDETQARLLASTLDLQEEELRELHALNKGNWPAVIGVLKTEQQRRASLE